MSALALATLRRLVPPWWLVLTLGLTLWAGAAHAQDDAAARALARTETFVVLLAVAPWLLLRAAGLARPSELRAWLAGGAARLAVALGTALGSALACVLTSLVLVLGCALGLDDGSACERLVARPALEPRVLRAADGPFTWSVTRVPGATHARLELGLALGGASTAALRWSVRAGAAEHSRAVEISGHTTLALELPPEGSDALLCTLALESANGLVLLRRDALELSGAGGSDHRASLHAALHATLALLLALAGALALARVLPAGLATLLALATVALAMSRAVAPLDGLGPAFDELARARVPAPPSAAAWAVTLGALGIATLVLAHGHRRGGAA